jgi:hypothetical protein
MGDSLSELRAHLNKQLEAYKGVLNAQVNKGIMRNIEHLKLNTKGAIEELEKNHKAHIKRIQTSSMSQGFKDRLVSAANETHKISVKSQIELLDLAIQKQLDLLK